MDTSSDQIPPYFAVGKRVLVRGYEKFGARTIVAHYPDIQGGVKLDQPVDGIYVSWNIEELLPFINTKLDYRRPTCRSPQGQYVSLTCPEIPDPHPAKKDPQWSGVAPLKVEIHLVWFDRMGWYYSIQVEALRFEKGRIASKDGFVIERDFSPCSWTRGNEVGLCALKAEQRAAEICQQVGFVPPPLAPYEIAKQY